MTSCGSWRETSQRVLGASRLIPASIALSAVARGSQSKAKDMSCVFSMQNGNSHDCSPVFLAESVRAALTLVWFSWQSRSLHGTATISFKQCSQLNKSACCLSTVCQAVTRTCLFTRRLEPNVSSSDDVTQSHCTREGTLTGSHRTTNGV